jgi:hypothetical protein
MRTRELVAAVVIAAFATACVENPDPRRPTIEKMQRTGIGGWVVATSRAGWQVAGELISATPQFIHVLRVGQPGPALVYLKTSEVARAEVYTYESEGGLGVFTVLGTLSTMSHGFLLVLTAPVWIIAGSIAIASETRHVHLDYPEDETLEDISHWARFPQGIPPNVDEEALLVPRVNRHKPSVPLTPAPVEPPAITAPGETPSTPAPTNPAAMFQQAKAAAARKDCALVLELSGSVQLADQAYWDAVFSKDATIRACLNLKP